MESESIGCPVGGEGCPCTQAGTCDGPLICASKVCVASDEITTGAESTAGVTTGAETSNATIAGECSPADDREHPDQCSEAVPFCNTKGLCVDCSGIASCAALDENKPACDPISGKCVACTPTDMSVCGGATPICDPESLSCRACEAHSECSKSACQFDTGTCFPPDQSLWVEGGARCDDSGPGTEVKPLCTIQRALEIIGAGPGTPRAVMVRSGKYGEPLVVPGKHVVAIVRAGTGKVEVVGVAAESVRVDTGATLFVDNLDIRGNTMGHGLACTSAAVWLDKTLVADQAVSGVDAKGCTLRVRSSVVSRNGSQGMMLSGGAVTVANSFVTDNGTADGVLRGGLVLENGAKATVVYSSFISNASFLGGGSTIDCDQVLPKETVQIRNSIMFKLGDTTTFNCGGVESVGHTAFSQDVDDPLDDNAGIPPGEALGLVTKDPGWFGVYRPKNGSKLASVGYYMAGDPNFDFEDDPRPPMSGYPGADQP